MSTRLDMTGRRISDDSIEVAQHTSSSPCKSTRGSRSFNTSELSMRSMRTSLTSSMSIGSTIDIDIDIHTDNISIESSTYEESLAEPTISTATQQPPNKETKFVRFAYVHLREYRLCLGDNPSVARGAPISLDWDCIRELKYSIDDFEKSERKKNVRGGLSLRRPSLERVHVLKELGYSRMEIKEATNEAHRIKEQRLQSRRQAERSDRIHAFLNAITCLFRSPHDFCDPENEILSESISTMSTHNSTIDWSVVGTDVAKASSSKKSSKNGSSKNGKKAKRTIQWLKQQDWHDQIRRQWELQMWQKRRLRDSLDLARHPKQISALDLFAGDPPLTLEERTGNK